MAKKMVETNLTIDRGQFEGISCDTRTVPPPPPPRDQFLTERLRYTCVYTLTCCQVDDCRITGRYEAVTALQTHRPTSLYPTKSAKSSKYHGFVFGSRLSFTFEFCPILIGFSLLKFSPKFLATIILQNHRCGQIEVRLTLDSIVRIVEISLGDV